MSGTKRDSLFPAGSIGRSQGPQFQRSASPTPSLTREPLTAHPLLSPTPSTSQVNTVPATTSETTHLSATPRYVPYTPRHRTAAATTGTTLQSSQPVAPQQQGGGATNKLQLMNLKASAQSIGLDTGSIGWEMLEKLVGEHDHTPEWNDIWSALTTGKGTLLLPLEQATHGNITPDFMKDHIVLCDGDSRDNASIVTLSGLRGTLTDTTLILRSSVQPGSSIFESLLTPTNRASALASLPPLPPVSSSPLSQTYPTFALESHTFTLSLPPHAASKPPLPPRPAARPGTSPAGSRLSSSFASLFGKPSPSTSPSPLPSLTQPEAEHAVEVSAFSIDRRIIRKDVSKTVNKAIKTELKEALSMSGVPSWAIDHVHEFTAGLYPFVKGPPHGKGSFATNGGSPTTPSYVIDPPKETSEELSQQFQDFYSGLEDEMRTVKSPITAKPRTSTFSDAEAEKEKDVARHTPEDDRAKEILEAIERVVCSLFYDRLYLQPSSDDASHDKALSGRITALNKLDLGLEHLGVDVGKSGPDVDILLASCGETLSQLDQSACRCPADKAAILVAAHKILVDGLSRLPPIRLKSEAELENQSTPGTTAAGTPPPKEEDDARPEKPTIETETSVFLTPDGETPPPIVVSPDTDLAFELPSVNPLSDVPTDPLTPPPHVSSLPPPRATSPRLVVSPPHTPTPVSGDLILPLMIYAVVRANPQHLVSHLLFTQRFRNQSFGGEESYCLVNLMAVADFLENVDLKALGLADSEKNVTSTANLTPIPVAQAALSPHSPTLPQGVPSRLRGRVEQQVDAIAGSANKVISGVVDSSFGVLRSFLPGTTPDGQQQQNLDSDAASWNAVRPAFGLLRRESGFSIASLAASLPGRERAKSTTSAVGMPAEEGGQMMIEVSSRPGSIRSAYVSDEGESEEGSEEEEEEGEEEEEEDDEDEVAGGHDTRSIRSFESMMAKSGKRRRHAKKRKTLSDRLASMPGLSKFATTTQPAVGSPPPSRRSSLLPVPNAVANRFDTPDSSRVASPTPMRIAPPHKRFMECSVDDLRVSEVGDLLMEYRRLAEGLKAIGGFDEA